MPLSLLLSPSLVPFLELSFDVKFSQNPVSFPLQNVCHTGGDSYTSLNACSKAYRLEW